MRTKNCNQIMKKKIGDTLQLEGLSTVKVSIHVSKRGGDFCFSFPGFDRTVAGLGSCETEENGRLEPWRPGLLAAEGGGRLCGSCKWQATRGWGLHKTTGENRGWSFEVWPGSSRAIQRGKMGAVRLDFFSRSRGKQRVQN
ncbi:hypothetical protein KFK09_001749 [Dendrobium nobile]|uniref:Uncharacterized protein n=1 Tax=Dendrobium nobile TaxID=94219 RepID=A0A8T3CBS6_DENNO|nr:hypothetical protein KFK09_001749 [Dendrobium nobile]